MRTIKKCGGLDQYLLGDKPARIKELGLFGWKLRWRVMNCAAKFEEFTLERERLPIPTPAGMKLREQPIEAFERLWEDDAVKADMLREQKKAWEELKEKDERFREHVRTRWEPKDKRTYGLDKHVIVRDPSQATSLADL